MYGVLMSFALAAVTLFYTLVPFISPAVETVSLDKSYTAPSIKANPLPAPRIINWGNEEAIGLKTFASIGITGDKNRIISEAFENTKSTIRQLKWTSPAPDKPFNPLLRPQDPGYVEPHPEPELKIGSQTNQIKVSVADLEADLEMNVDESYILNVTHGAAIEIKANTTWGVLHAFSTLQQLIVYQKQDGEFVVERPVVIEDKPIYPHRGILIDSSRHYLTIESILKQIDALSASKMNVLHWHMTDGQSWPIVLESVPEMIKGAYSNEEVYTKQDIKRIVEYAYVRGVRIVPEIDSPGHSYEGWKDVDPDLLACATARFSNSVNNYQVDIMNEKVYEYFEKIHNEIASMFSDNLFHVGADELDHRCFQFSERIQNWFKEDESRTDNDLLEYWFDKVLPIFNASGDNNNNRRLVMWEDSVLSPLVSAKNVPKDVIMQSWNFAEKGSLKKLAQLGYDVIVSSSSHLYLDCGYGLFVNGKVAPAVCDPYKTWQVIYGYNFTQGLNSKEQEKIVGAEAALFGEQVDSTVLSQKIWPRTAALAELTWSGNLDSNGKYRDIEFAQRLQNFREFLVKLDVQAPPLQPKYCIEHPHACDINNYYGHV